MTARGIYKWVMARKLVALAVVVVAAAGAFALFGGARAVDPVAAAATKTENAGGARLDLTVAFTDPAGKSYTVTAKGEFDRTQGDITADLSGVLGSAGLPTLPGTAKVELRYLQVNGDPVLYVNVPFVSLFMPDAKPWLRLDLQQAGKSVGLDVNQLLAQAGQNPASALDLLRAAGSVDRVGSETIDGVSTTHYKATVDLQKAVAELPGDLGSSLSQRVATDGDVQVPLDVWIGGDDGLVHRLALDEQFTHDGQTAALEVTANLSDYGTDVNVSAPPADQVTDVTDQVAKAGAASGLHLS